MSVAAAVRVEAEPTLDLLVRSLAARARARSYLWKEGWIDDLHDVGDPLWIWAEERGIVAALGSDAVQKILSDALRKYRRW